ncbi:MAG: stalk domain-containing protein [Tepidibacter sp.]|jgi:hypothetical protein|uniref:copper amine oxidase N-terminal domain-containing protein n=1 Tax=Tepidibacter sp. TaxID=2529387 RepID=UPI0025FA2381|nr:stalk domain-containing protein [Tepidibacter sp.]MCT4509598.1 stalk domain-containing protein [Tepidibacter sp.]
MHKRIVTLILAGVLMLPTSSFAMENNKQGSTNGNVNVKKVSARQDTKEKMKKEMQEKLKYEYEMKDRMKKEMQEKLKYENEMKDKMKIEVKNSLEKEIKEKTKPEMIKKVRERIKTREEVKKEINEKIKKEMVEEIKKEMQEELKKEIKQELREEEKEAIKEKIRKKMIQKMKEDMRKKLKQEVKKERREQIKALKEAAKEAYDKEELIKIEERIKTLKEEYPNMRVLPVQNIISKKMNFKFDTPPVVKEGRTLLPVRGIAEGLKADISWDGETNEVTITKDGKNIVLKIDSNVAIVDGKEVELDSKAEIMNGRTVIPVRFVAENLGLKVKWDSEEESIEIEEEGSETIDETITEEDIEKELETEIETEVESEEVENNEVEAN